MAAAATPTDRGVPLSTLCPKFLHTNSTSHTWPFSAIAELIDNAYDPDVSAKQMWIDKTQIKDKECLMFMDNGNGLSYEGMHKMLSFGYSEKIPVNGKYPIGMYGNGFKSGSMRLGKDVIVFSKSKSSLCVGMLSQNYLEAIAAKQIIVPIISFEESTTHELCVAEKHRASLRDILRHSPFKTQAELLTEIRAITSSCSRSTTGTRIIIWNLRRTSEGTTELDFQQDRYDIRIPSDFHEGITKEYKRPERQTSSIPESDYSLRAYCRILYLKPRMKINIRGEMVKMQLISKNLALIAKDKYKPTFIKKCITITFGYNTNSKDQYGIMMYHKNRLIKSYERVGCQLRATNTKGVGVIGVIECDFLEPTHNKQDFDNTDKYRKTINNLAIKMEDYWKEIAHKNKNSAPVEDIEKKPDQNWVQCEDCLKWRKVPDGMDCEKIPHWFCNMNPNPCFRSCAIREELEDSDSEQPTNKKTYKKQEREDKLKQEIEKRMCKEEKKRQAKRQAKRRSAEAKKMKQKLPGLSFQPAVHSPSTPYTHKSSSSIGMSVVGAARDEASLLGSSNLSQDPCTPSCSSSLPVIANVYSEATPPSGMKRLLAETPDSVSKRSRLNESKSSTPDTAASTVDTSLVLKFYEGHDDNDTTDDEICVMEAVSTPKPTDPAKVKLEPESQELSFARERNYTASDTALEMSAVGSCGTETPAIGTGPFALPPPEQTSTAATQTKTPRVKDEVMEEGSMSDTRDQKVGESVTEQQISGSKAREQQDHLLERLQAASEERDHYKEQVHHLTLSLKDMETRTQGLSGSLDNLGKKECTPQSSQTEELGEDYQSLYDQARQRIDELAEEKKALLEAMLTNPKPSSPQQDGGKLDALMQLLEQSNKESSVLRLQVFQLEGDRDTMSAQCEQLKLIVEQLKAADSTSQTANSSVKKEPEEAEGTVTSHEETFRSLLELRQNVGRLLVSHVPALDLGQINYNCDVIDEILEQFLSGRNGQL